MSARPLVSILVPVFNSESVLQDLHTELGPVLDAIEGGAEVVFVDDGSSDGTIETLVSLQRKDPRIRIVELATNFGQHAAISAGFEYARGTYFVTMDADLQFDPRDIPKLLAPLRQGYDLVSGVRLERRDPLFRRWLSKLVTWMVVRMAGVHLTDVGCPFNAFTAEVGRNVAAFGELRRFLKPLAVRLSRRVTEVEVMHRARPRTRRESSYSSTGLIRLFMDFFVNAMGDVFAWIFVLGSGLAFVLLMATIAETYVASTWGMSFVPAVVTLALTIVTALVALLGLGGDYVQRIHRQSSGRPFYLVRRVHDAHTASSRDDRTSLAAVSTGRMPSGVAGGG